MAIVTTTQEKVEYDNELLKKGIYRGKLTEIKPKEALNKYKGIMETKLVWMFDVDDLKKSNDYPFRLFKRTGTTYGNEKAALTLLINEIYGRPFTSEEYEGFDVQQLEGQPFEFIVGVERWDDDKPDHPGHNVILGIEALDPASLPYPPGVAPVDQPMNGRAPDGRVSKPPIATPEQAADIAADYANDPDGPPLSEAQCAALAKRLKLSDEEAERMDLWGRLPNEEGYRDPDPFRDN